MTRRPGHEHKKGNAYGPQGAAQTTDSDLETSSQSDLDEDADMPQLQTDEDEEDDDNIKLKYKVGMVIAIQGCLEILARMAAWHFMDHRHTRYITEMFKCMATTKKKKKNHIISHRMKCHTWTARPFQS